MHGADFLERGVEVGVVLRGDGEGDELSCCCCGCFDLTGVVGVDLVGVVGLRDLIGDLVGEEGRVGDNTSTTNLK